MFDLAAAGQMRKQMAQRDQQWPSESRQHFRHLAKGVQLHHLGAEGAGLHLGEEGVRGVGAPQREEGVHHPAVDMEALQNRETEWTQMLGASTCRAHDTCTATVAALCAMAKQPYVCRWSCLPSSCHPLYCKQSQ